MKKFISILFILFFVVGYSQNYADKKAYLVDSIDLSLLTPPELDYLNTELDKFKKSDNDTLKLYTLSLIVERIYEAQIWTKYNRLMLEMAEIGLQKEVNDSLKKVYLKYKAFATNNIGFYYDNTGRPDLAIKNFLAAEKIYEQIDNKTELANIFNNMAHTYMNLGNYEKSIELYQKSYDLRIELKDEDAIANSLNNIGVVYGSTGKFEKSLEYYEQSLSIRKKLKNDFGIASNMMNIGIIYLKMNKPNTALDYLTKGQKIHEKINNKQGVAACLKNIGIAYSYQGKYDKTIENIQQALDIYSEINDKEGVSNCHRFIGMAQLKTNQTKEGEQSLLKSYEIGKEIGYPFLIETAARELYLFYKEKNQSNKALQFHELYIQMKDSVESTATKQLLLQNDYKKDIEEQLEKDSNQKEIKVLETENELLKEKVSSQSTLVYSLYTVIGLLLIILGITYFKTKKG